MVQKVLRKFQGELPASLLPAPVAQRQIFDPTLTEKSQSVNNEDKIIIYFV